MSVLFNWLDDRTGYRGILYAALYENVPGGSRWRYVWGSTLAFTFMVQMLTGMFLWMAYSPSSQTAWESVYYIEHEMSGGWLLRGIHHYTAHAMVVLLVLHVMQVVIDGAYKAPREINFWIGLVLGGLVFALALTGYLLPWDQKGYWATKVSTNLVAIVPGIGQKLQTLIVGGTDYGHHTLTRFFALHAGALPGLLIVLTVVHVFLFRRHGLTARKPKRRPDESFWPDQALKDAVACLAVMAAVLILTLWMRVPLGAPADPSQPYAAARPEWYFLFLFELLKHVPELWGAILIPAILGATLLLVPIVGRWKFGHLFNIALVVLLAAAAATLTTMAWRADYGNPDHNAALQEADMEANRVLELIRSRGGIPPEGAVELLRNDPRRLFAENCATCHTFNNHDGMGNPVSDPTAADLAGFAGQQWLTDFLDPAKIATPRFFGNTKFSSGDMVDFVTETVSDFDEEEKQALAKAIDALATDARLDHSRSPGDASVPSTVQIRGWMEFVGCIDCHRFYGAGGKKGPDLTGYGSRRWMLNFVHDPSHPRFYGKKNDSMPAFGAEGHLTGKQIAAITDWLRESKDETRP